MKKHFQYLQASLGPRRGPRLQRLVSNRAIVLLAISVAVTALLSAQSLDHAASPSPEPSPATTGTADEAPSAVNAPALPDPSLPVPAEIAPPPPLPEPAPTPAAAETVLLEAEPLPQTNAPAPAATDSAGAAPPFAAPTEPPPPAPTPPLRTGDVAFSTPAVRNDAEPLVAIGRPVGKTDYGVDGNRRATQLRSMPPERFTFDRAVLRDVLYFLADASGIPFVSIPENAPQAHRLVTFRMTESPFAALESVLQSNSLKLSFVNGVWVVAQKADAESFREDRERKIREKQDESELIGVMYQLRFDSADKIEFRGAGGVSGGMTR